MRKSWARCPSASPNKTRHWWRRRSARPLPSSLTRKCDAAFAHKRTLNLLTWCREQVDKAAAGERGAREGGHDGAWRSPPTRSSWRARAAWRRTQPSLRSRRAGTRGGRKGVGSSACRRAQLRTLF